jgi:hypothetical protein
VTTKRVGNTLTVEHLANERGLRIVDQQTAEAVFVPLLLVRALSSALLDAAADVAGGACGGFGRGIKVTP